MFYPMLRSTLLILSVLGVCCFQAPRPPSAAPRKASTVTLNMAMRILYPQDPLHPKQADGPYQDEYQALVGLGVDCSRFDFDGMLAWDEFAPFPRIQPGETILYRGWMLNPDGYRTLTQHIEKRGGNPFTTTDH